MKADLDRCHENLKLEERKFAVCDEILHEQEETIEDQQVLIDNGNKIIEIKVGQIDNLQADLQKANRKVRLFKVVTLTCAAVIPVAFFYGTTQ